MTNGTNARATGQELKRLRQRAIQQLITSRPIGSQRELVDALLCDREPVALAERLADRARDLRGVLEDGGHAALRSPVQGCWLLTETTSPVRYDA